MHVNLDSLTSLSCRPSISLCLSLCLCVQVSLDRIGALMRMMCSGDKTRLWPPVKHQASLALIIDRAGGPLEGFTRAENIALTTATVNH